MASMTDPAPGVLAQAQLFLFQQVVKAVRFGYPVVLVRLEWDGARGKKRLVVPPPWTCTCGGCRPGKGVKCTPWFVLAPDDEQTMIRKIQSGLNAYLIRTDAVGVAVRDADTPEVVSALLSLSPRHVVRTPRGGIHAYYRGPRVRSAVDGEDTMMTQVYGPGSFYERHGQLVSYLGDVPHPAELDPLPDVLAREVEAQQVRRRVGERQLKPRSVAAREFDRLRDQLLSTLADGRRGVWHYDTMRDLAAHLVRLCGPEVAAQVWDWAFGTVGVAQDDDDVKHIESAIEKFGEEADDVRPDEQIPEEIRFWVGGQLPPDRAPGGHGPMAATVSITPPGATTNLPGEFWRSRDSLKRIQDAAHAAFRSADAVLGAVLARLASMLPPKLRVDTGVGVPASLNLFVVLCGASGSGKSTSALLADQLFHTDTGAFFGFLPADESSLFVPAKPIGSGEGMADEFMGSIEDFDPAAGKVTRQRKQVRHRAMFSVDEGATLLESAARPGATLLPMLRQAWTGAPFGMKNATVERDRYVENYAMGLWMGLQPSHAARLLSEQSVDEGTLQRFVWFSSTDPTIPEYSTGPVSSLLWDAQVIGETVLGDRMPFPHSLSTQLSIETSRINRGELIRPAGREHEPLQLIKLSGLLALLDGRTGIELSDWSLAQAIAGTSAAVVDSIRAGAARRAAEREDAFVRRQARRAEALAEAEQARGAEVETTVRQRIVALVVANPGETPGRLRKRFRSDHRRVVDEILPDLLESGELALRDGVLTLP